ncbi:CARDB domain-containing protein [Methanocaldococcus infernus]
MRGQLSLELVILMLLAILGGAIVTTQLVQSAKDLNLSSEPAKKDIIGVFLGPDSLTLNVETGQENGSIINKQQENNNSNNTNNETNQNTIEQNNEEQNNSILPDLTVSISAYYENGSLCCHGKHGVRNRGEDQQLQNRFRYGKIKVGDKLVIYGNITNIGSADVNKTFWVRIYEEITNKTIATFPINKLNVNETVTFNFTVNVTKDGLKCGKCYCHRYGKCYGNGCSISTLGNVYIITAYVDYTNTINESNENNNIDYVILKRDEDGGQDNGGSTIAGLWIILRGHSYAYITNNSVGGYPVNGDLGYINVRCRAVLGLDVNGVLRSGIIDIRGHGNLYLGNVTNINNLNLIIRGNSILEIENLNITNIYVENMRGRGIIIIKNSHVKSLKINTISCNPGIVIQNSIIDNLQAPSNGVIVVYNSTINGEYIEYTPDYNP